MLLVTLAPACECYQRLENEITGRFRRSFDYVKNSSVGKFLGNMKDEIKFSAYKTKESLKKPETRKLWIKNHIPEFITIGFLAYWGVSEQLYYSNPILARLAKEGLTTNGTYVTDYHGITIPVTHSINVIKPFVYPQLDQIPRDSLGNIPAGYTRKLSPLENDYLQGFMGTLPTIGKYSKKGVKHFKNKMQ
jgi:hypothetical protein